MATLLLLFLTGTANGQRSGFGLKAGPQLNTYQATNIRTTMIPGFSVGAYAPIGAAPRLELQPEVLITMLGTGFIEPDGDRYMIRTLYAQIPISAKYFFDTQWNLQGGVQFGQLLIAQRSDANGTSNTRDQFRSFDMGFNLGMGYDLHHGLDITLRYYSGMPTLLKDDQTLYPRNRSLQLTVGKRLKQFKKVPQSRRRK